MPATIDDPAILGEIGSALKEHGVGGIARPIVGWASGISYAAPGDCMSVEIKFPIEFVVEGTPVSLQRKRRSSVDQWKAQIIDASRAVLPQGHFATSAALAITLFYFPANPMEGDLDNIVKPILDALDRHIYMNDRQIHRILVQKFELEQSFEFGSPSPTLQDALNKPRPMLYIRIADDPFEDMP
jgi:crossover junction endodeoxyribonuclease RusA